MSSKVIGYIRISTDRQDLDKQRHLLLEHARQQHLFIDEFVEIEMSSRKSNAARRIDELIAKIDTGDLLLVSEKSVEITFIRQPELSTSGDYGKLLLAIYSYFAEAERTFISLRVKQGLAAARAKGVKLGRPKGSRNRERILDAHRDEILKCLRRGVDLANTRKMINPELERPISYNSYKYFVQHDIELAEAWTAQRQR